MADSRLPLLSSLRSLSQNLSSRLNTSFLSLIRRSGHLKQARYRVFIYEYPVLDFPQPEAADHCHTFIPAPLTPLVTLWHDMPLSIGAWRCCCWRLLWMPAMWEAWKAGWQHCLSGDQSWALSHVRSRKLRIPRPQAAKPRRRRYQSGKVAISRPLYCFPSPLPPCLNIRYLLPKSPHHPGLNPPINSYLLNLTRTNISFPPKISTHPLQKRRNAQLKMAPKATRPWRFFPARPKPTSISSWAPISWRQTQSWDNSLDFFRPQSRLTFPAIISQTHHVKHAPSQWGNQKEVEFKLNSKYLQDTKDSFQPCTLILILANLFSNLKYFSRLSLSFS